MVIKDSVITKETKIKRFQDSVDKKKIIACCFGTPAKRNKVKINCWDLWGIVNKKAKDTVIGQSQANTLSIEKGTGKV